MGFDSQFIAGILVPLPTLSDRIRIDAFDEGRPIEHTRFSIVFHERRGLAIFTAHNIDGQTMLPSNTIPRKDRFRFDVSIPRQIQIDNDQGYYKNPYDRGHLVRRVALHWGDPDEARQADAESYYWTNIAPQHERLHDTAWGNIEDWMLALSNDRAKRACVFTGPVLTSDDREIVNRPGERPFQLPAGFWKVLAVKHNDALCAAAFIVWQRDFDVVNPVQFDSVLEQVRISTVEVLTGLSFDTLRHADPLHFQAADGSPEAMPFAVSGTPIRNVEDVVLVC